MLRLQNVSKRFNIGNDREVVALDHLTFTLGPGEFVVMVGENGSGKSTFFRVVTGEVFADSGQAFLGEKDVSHMEAYRRARYVTHIHQSRESGLPLSLTVEEVMRLAYESRHPARVQSGTLRKDVGDRLETFRRGLSGVLKEQIWHLSGGEHQLVSLAVASIFADGQPKGSHVLLLDEHVSQLDPIAHDVVMEATDRLIRAGQLSTVMATHNCELAVRYGDRQIVLSQGRIAREFSGDSRIRSVEALKECVSGVAR
jgi:putative ABC transport system ATP-binding protein